jgi:hypothetical protein
MVLHELMLAVFPITRYFLINQIFASILIGAGSFFVFKHLKNNNQIYSMGTALIVLIVAISLYSARISLSNAKSAPDYSYGRYVPGNVKSMENAAEWINHNTPKDSVVISPRANDVTFYAKRDCWWLNQSGGSDVYEAFLSSNADQIHSVAKQFNHSYILIPKFWVVNSDTSHMWISFIQQSSVDSIRRSDTDFRLVYKNTKVEIYKTI